MKLFGRNKVIQKTNEVPTKAESITLDEQTYKGLREDATQISSLVASIKEVTPTYESLQDMYETMSKDGVVDAALELISDDVTQTSDTNGKIIHLKCINKETLEYYQKFIDNKKLEENLWQIAYNVLKYGAHYFLIHKKTRNQILYDVTFEELTYPTYSVIPLYSEGEKIGYYVTKKKANSEEKDIGKIYPVEAIISFANPRNSVSYPIDVINSSGEVESYTVKVPQSFLYSSIQPWKIKTLLEDLLVVSRIQLTSSDKVVSVEVGNADRNKTRRILSDVKSAFKSEKSFDSENNKYNTYKSPLATGEAVYIPTREGKGQITINAPDVNPNISSIADIDYAKNNFFGTLSIPKAFLGFSEEAPGGIGDTSLAKLDLRYLRTARRYKGILVKGLESMLNEYSKVLSVSKPLIQDKVEVSITPIIQDEDNGAKIISEVDAAERLLNFLKDIDLNINVEKYIELVESEIFTIQGVKLGDIINPSSSVSSEDTPTSVDSTPTGTPVVGTSEETPLDTGPEVPDEGEDLE